MHVVNAETGYPSTNLIAVRRARQTWEYETVTVRVGQDGAAVLNAQDAAGWETAGVTFAAADATMVLLKRPR